MNIEVLKRYSETQFAQIVKLQEKIKSLQEELSHLKELLKAAVPITRAEVQEALSTEEQIAEREIHKLNDLSQKEILTYEECKKLIEYTKIVQGRRQKEKNDNPSKELSDDELLAKLNS